MVNGYVYEIKIHKGSKSRTYTVQEALKTEYRDEVMTALERFKPNYNVGNLTVQLIFGRFTPQDKKLIDQTVEGLMYSKDSVSAKRELKKELDRLIGKDEYTRGVYLQVYHRVYGS